jgi:hypothetical protein
MALSVAGNTFIESIPFPDLVDTQVEGLRRLLHAAFATVASCRDFRRV